MLGTKMDGSEEFKLVPISRINSKGRKKYHFFIEKYHTHSENLQSMLKFIKLAFFLQIWYQNKNLWIRRSIKRRIPLSPRNLNENSKLCQIWMFQWQVLNFYCGSPKKIHINFSNINSLWFEYHHLLDFFFI